MKSWLRIAAALACGFCVTADADAAARAFTPTDLNMLARVSDPQVSPDGRYVVYVQRETDLDANRGRTDLWLRRSRQRAAEAAAAHAALGQRHASALGRAMAPASISSPRAPAPSRSGACR